MRYIGEFFNNRFHGRGKELYEDGSTFTGHYIDGKRSTIDPSTFHNTELGYTLEVKTFDENKQPTGQVICRFASGSIYEGDWLNGHMHGSGGTLKQTDGSIYHGDFRSGKFHG